MDLRGKKVVVTGASAGIGHALAACLDRKGAEVTAAARNIGERSFISKKIRTMECDLRFPEQVDALLEEAAGAMGGIDIFIANAGMGYYGKTSADWGHMEDIFKLNVFSPIYTLTKLCALYPKRKFGFVLMDSGAGLIPLPGYALYCSTKFALDGFARTFRFEQPANVKLSVVYPASVDTGFFEKAADDAPPPRPVKPLGVTAANIVRGIEAEKDEIFPARVIPVLTAVNRIFPVVETVYDGMESRRFGRWLRNHSGKS